MNVKEFIKIIQKNPKMFVDEVRTDYIEHLILGFFICCNVNNNATDIDLHFHAHFSRWLVRWIWKNVDKKYSQKYFSWSQTLKDINITNDEIQAVKLFFDLSDMFFEKYKVKEYPYKRNCNNRITLREYIKLIEKKPQAVLYEVRIDYLEYVIDGFKGCNGINDFGDDTAVQFHHYFSNWLVRWIQLNIDKKYEKQHFFWYHTFRDITNNEAEAVKLFFTLCDKFFKEYENKELI